MKKLYGKYGSSGQIPQSFRDMFRSRSLPMMKWTNILTFNTRAIVLYVVCLLDMPWLYFFFEIVVMGFLYNYMHFSHEKFCKELVKNIKK